MENDKNNISSASSVDATHVDAANGGGTVVQPTSISLEDINTLLKTDFKDKDTALKSLKETQSLVGRREADYNAKLADALKNVAPSGDFITKSQYETDMFYKDNPNLAPYRDFIDSGAKGKGVSPREFVSDDGFKSIFEKVKTADEYQNAKSVLDSNPRLGQASTRIQSAAEKVSTNFSQAKSEAIGAVMDAYELK